MRRSLAGTSVLITGASAGLGAALAMECARRGARLALCGRDLKALQRVAQACLRSGAPLALPLRMDVTRRFEVRRACARAERMLGGVEVLVNNAGIHLFAEVERLPERLFRKILETNLFGPLRLVQALLPGMKRRGSGLVVQIGSNLAWRSIPRGGAYSASKAALARLTESLRDETARYGIRVLHVAPGVVRTRLRERALRVGVKPEPTESLPFPRSAAETAREIADAMEQGRREHLSAAWPVKLWTRWLVPHAPSLIDRWMRLP